MISLCRDQILRDLEVTPLSAIADYYYECVKDRPLRSCMLFCRRGTSHDTHASTTTLRCRERYQ